MTNCLKKLNKLGDGAPRHSLFAEHGDGPGTIIVYASILGVVWFICYSILNWVYETKEAKLARGFARFEESQEARRAYGVGGYIVTYDVSMFDTDHYVVDR